MKRLLLAITLAALAIVAFGAELTITVTDRDLEFPLEGALLSLSSLQGFSAEAETDAEGIAVITLPPQFARGTLVIQYPGYAPVKQGITAEMREVSVGMTITGIIEGKELVVERTVPGVTDEKSGVSVVMDKREMESTANMGIVEDVMSSIKTLPGVGFSGGWNAQPSIRGGYPDEMGTVMDGVYLLMPWHWGGAYSIFNPNMVESAKMSHGVFSTRYGRALSGLLEVNTVNPDSPRPRFDAGISTTALDLFAQFPVTNAGGVFLGGKVTWMDTLKVLNDDILDLEPKLRDNIPVMPFIRDFYAKGFWKPTSQLSVTANAFFGSDGVGVETNTEDGGIASDVKFNWLYLQGFGAAHVKWMPSEFTVINFTGAYNNMTSDLDFNMSRSGGRKYSTEFVSVYDTLPGVDTGASYSVDGLDLKGFSQQVVHQAQGKFEADIQVAPGHIVSFGTDEVFQYFTSKSEFSGWQIIPMPYPLPSIYQNVVFENNLSGNRILSSAAFVLWSFGGEQSTFSGELGLRGEHFYLWNNNFTLNTYPVANPRLNLTWKPIKNGNLVDTLTLTAGSGLFSFFPTDSIAADKKYGLESFKITPNRTIFQVIGADAGFRDGWSFRLETYYKHYLSRLFLAAGVVNDEVEYYARTNGQGYAAGFDLMLRKKDGRYFDGYLTYSFVYSRYNNPLTLSNPEATSINGEPLDSWFYPSFHRFHSLNLILNIKPVQGITFTVKSSVASGKPRERPGEITMQAVQYGSQYIEQYLRDSTYDDTLRTDLSCPVDVRLSWSNYYRESKIRWEYYVGAEDIFVNLYKPKSNTGFDEYTGKEIPDSGSADFNIGIPVFSVGYKVSY